MSAIAMALISITITPASVPSSLVAPKLDSTLSLPTVAAAKSARDSNRDLIIGLQRVSTPLISKVQSFDRGT
jgi:hypothetical protein